VHIECFNKWQDTCLSIGKPATCVVCRKLWRNSSSYTESDSRYVGDAYSWIGSGRDGGGSLADIT
jgi:hypothetical protein